MPKGLFHPESHTLLATIFEEGVKFSKEGQAFADSIKKSGIHIPHYALSEFNGSKIISFSPHDGSEESKLFAKAFESVLFPFELREQGFTLEDIE